MSGYGTLYVRHAAVAITLTVFRLNNLCNGLESGKCFSRSCRKFRATLDLTDLLNGGLYQITFLLRRRFVEGGVVVVVEYCRETL